MTDLPNSGISDDELTTLRQEMLTMAEALHGIAQDSPDADIVRAAVAGLQASSIGLHLLQLRQLTV